MEKGFEIAGTVDLLRSQGVEMDVPDKRERKSSIRLIGKSRSARRGGWGRSEVSRVEV